MYAVLPFGIATGLVEIPYLLLQSVIFVPIMYFLVGFRMNVEAFFLFIVIFMGMLADSYEYRVTLCVTRIVWLGWHEPPPTTSLL